MKDGKQMNPINEMPFHELLAILKEYVSVFTKGNTAEREAFMRKHGGIFTDDLHQYLREFLNAVGISDEFIDELYKRQASIPSWK